MKGAAKTWMLLNSKEQRERLHLYPFKRDGCSSGHEARATSSGYRCDVCHKWFPFSIVKTKAQEREELEAFDYGEDDE